MQKVILSLALLSGATVAANAQSGTTLGVKAGASLTNWTGDVSGNSSKLGFHGGLVVDFGINDQFSIQPELLYSMKGIQSSVNSKIKFNVNYIDVPVLAKIKTTSGLFFEVGPQLGFRTSAKVTDGTTSIDMDKIAYKTQSVDFGYAAGLGYAVPGGGPMLGLRYNGGLTSIADGDGSDKVKLRNSAFQLYVGYMFGGK